VTYSLGFDGLCRVGLLGRDGVADGEHGAVDSPSIVKDTGDNLLKCGFVSRR
jgi:hypothetical protein